jgi:uncharacterized membrane protein
MRDAEAPDAPALLAEPYESAEQPTLVVHGTRAGAIQAIDGAGLVRFARGHGCRLVLPYGVGDFVPSGAPLVELYGGSPVNSGTEPRLRGMVAFGEERTIEQDPAFAIRIMADIAVRALSPAVNDPTTAVQVVDHLGDLLLLIGTTDLEGHAVTAPEQAGGPPVMMPGRSWEDFLTLGVTEIREYGRRSVQVHRRLRAMLEELRDSVQPSNRVAVEEELSRLAASAERNFVGSDDYDRAIAADRQGIGGFGGQLIAIEQYPGGALGATRATSWFRALLPLSLRPSARSARTGQRCSAG